MNHESPRDDFLDRMVEICRLLGIEAPPDQEGDVIAYRLDIDEATFLLEHSKVDSVESFLVRCQLGRVPERERTKVITHLLQANTWLAENGFGAVCLDDEGQIASCIARIALGRTDQQVLTAMLAIRNVARGWYRHEIPYGLAV